MYEWLGLKYIPHTYIMIIITCDLYFTSSYNKLCWMWVQYHRSHKILYDTCLGKRGSFKGF